MSPEITELVLNETSCDFCGARLGGWCRTKGGYIAPRFHSSRSWAIGQAYAMGFSDGWAESP